MALGYLEKIPGEFYINICLVYPFVIWKAFESISVVFKGEMGYLNVYK
jgi:hypothetical protein